MISPGEHVTIFGITGSGKSTLTRQVESYFPRAVIFDRLGDWKNEVADHVTGYADFARIYKERENADHFRIVVRFRPGISPEDLDYEFGAILNLVYEREKHARLGLLLLIEEVWIYTNPHYLNPWLQEILFAGRPERISVLSNSQRPASVNKAITSQSRHIFVGQHFDQRDVQYFKEILGHNYNQAERLAKFHFCWFQVDSGKSTIIQTDSNIATR